MSHDREALKTHDDDDDDGVFRLRLDTMAPGHEPATRRGSGLSGRHSVIGRVSPAARRALASVVLHGVLNPWRFFDCAQ